ncbi:NAD(P)/FAD-dependent oxidoreductase [Paracidobacterium acidisoli]|uniref:NAD(P)/FAD-dependent oxidoreductase n=1 Tax=Paracidobacterium acidisoli TaxID=2303751 RepID=UPI001314E7C7|nr:NAD(P)/FAD-dependent oxidoreductase [Paracidobacterium acidisoli]MBT9332810.1 NAD(P)/FAD-dependent oxidoreductase [Paracidobacterium acidisoli]
MKQSCDVLIVGGGPAGLAAAIALRLRGADVLVADALQPPIDKACGEGLMPDSLDALSRLGVDLPPDAGAPFRGIRFVDERSFVSAEFGGGRAGLGIRRLTLHSLLVRRAEEAGVRTAWGSPVVVQNGLPIRVGGERCRYQWLVGADGHASRVRSWAGLEDRTLKHRRFGFRMHYRVRPWSPYVEIHWSDLGQAYVTPLSEQEVCVAVVSRFPERARVREFVNSNPLLRARLYGAEATTRERGAITTSSRLRRVVSGNVALVGDASGSVDAITGEGLAVAFRQAALLTESIAAGDLARYASQHAGTLRVPQTIAAAMLLMDQRPSLRRRVLRVFAERPALFQKLLTVHLREEPLPKLLLRYGPELGARLLLAGQF